MEPGTPEEDDARLWRAVAVFRGLALLYAVALFLRVQDEYRSPGGAWLVLAVMAAWTAFLTTSVTAQRRPGRATVAVDLVLACAAVLATGFVDDPARVEAGAQTLPSIWAASAVLAWAVSWGPVAGFAAGAAVSAADVVLVGGEVTPAVVNNIVLLLLAGAIVGYAVRLFRQGRRELAAAAAAEAATAERERLARDIHDSVLQVLAYVQRRGAEVGGEAAEIGRLAGEQEARLRALVVSGPAPAADAGGEQDLRAAVSALSGRGVTVVAGADAVLLPAHDVAVLAAAAREAVGNVARHAGPDASTWVLVEDDGGCVAVTVRDDGAGIPDGRLAEAAAQGRLGVASSIVGRVEEIGGTVRITSAPGEGTEVELTLRRDR